jgi:hypothetical protein
MSSLREFHQQRGMLGLPLTLLMGENQTLMRKLKEEKMMEKTDLDTT